MSAHSLARRYATALFDVATPAGTAERAGQDLAALAALICRPRGLSKVFEAPAIPASVKTAMMTALLNAAGDVAVEVKRLMLLLAERGRLNLLPDVAASYADNLMHARRVVRGGSGQRGAAVHREPSRARGGAGPRDRQ